MNNNISVIIPCYNEWAIVWELVRHVLAIFDNQVEIIISDQSSTDEIFTSCKSYLNSQVVWTKSPGNCRSATMNHWANFATGDLLVFLHADTQLPIEAKHELTSLDLKKYIGWGFMKVYSPYTFWTSIMTTLLNWIRIYSKQFFGDNVIFCSRSVFLELWWYSTIKLFEDVERSKRVSEYAKKHHQQIYVCEYPVITSSRKYIVWWFWNVFFQQMKLQIKYKFWLFDDTVFFSEYYHNQKHKM